MKKSLAVLLLAMSTNCLAQSAPATNVEVRGLQNNPYPPTLGGPVLVVKTAEGYARMSIQGDGGIRFEAGATLRFEDLVVGKNGNWFVPIWVRGQLVLLQVFSPSVADD